MALHDQLASCRRPLSHCDELARVTAILEEAAEIMQIVVLTCHPERYRGIAGATFIDLEQCTQH